MRDPACEVLVGVLEGVVGVDADRVGHGPVQPDAVRAAACTTVARRTEILVGVVADGDEQVAGVGGVVQVVGPGAPQP